MQLHPKFHQQNLNSDRIASNPFSMMSLYNPNLTTRPSKPKLLLNKNLGCSLQLSSIPTPAQVLDTSVSPPESPVTTELALGQTKVGNTIPGQTHHKVKDFLGCFSSESRNKILDPNSFKKLLKGLTDKVWWQQDAASAVATCVTQCKMGNGKRRGGATKGDTWLLFLGPDKASKKKMAVALSELLYGSPHPIIISLAARRGHENTDFNVRGKTALDRIAEAIKRNPFSVIMLENVDEADSLIRGSINRAMEQGRFCDSHGREISLGNVIFILTAHCEEKLVKSARAGFKLRLSVAKRKEKRRPEWLSLSDEEEQRPSIKPRKENVWGLELDLNEAADAEEEGTDGSRNSSDITVDHEDNTQLHSPTTPLIPRELLDGVDDAIVFNPVDVGTVGRRHLKRSREECG